MALQIRRGTELELSTFTPAEGELIFDKTNKKVYVGDGQTVGGLDVSIAGGIGGPLSSGINLNTYSITGLGDINITGSIAVSGSVTGDVNGDVIGSLVGDVYGNLIGGSVFGSDSSVLVDSITNKITGNLTGNVIGINGDIVLDNSLQIPVLYGTVSGTVIGNVIGDVEGAVLGDLQGSVFGDDSSVLVDSINNVLSNGTIRIEGTIIRCASSIDLRSTVNSGTAVAVSLNSTSTTQGALLSGAAGIQRFDLVTYGSDKEDPVDIVSGDIFGSIGFTAIQASTSAESVSIIGVQADPNGQTTPTHIATKFFVVTQPDTESKVGLGQFPFLTFDSFGRLAVNQENAQATCDINGIMRLAPQNGAPSTPVEGMIAIADRENWDPASVGSGNSYPVYFDGQTWIKLS